MSRIHHVQPGDRFSSIAQAYGIAPRALLAANPTKPRVRTLGGAEVFAELSFGEPITIPRQNAVECIDPHAYIDAQGNCVCDPGYFVAPTGHCMHAIAFHQPRDGGTFARLGGDGDACSTDADCGGGTCMMNICMGGGASSSTSAPAPANCQPFKLDTTKYRACPSDWDYTLPTGGWLCLPDGNSNCYDQAQPAPGTQKFSGSLTDAGFKVPAGMNCSGNGTVGWCWLDTLAGGVPPGGSGPMCTKDTDCTSGNACQGGVCVGIDPGGGKGGGDPMSLPPDPAEYDCVARKGGTYDASTGVCTIAKPGDSDAKILAQAACKKDGGTYDMATGVCTPAKAPAPDNTKRNVFIGIAAVAVLAIAGGGIYVATRPSARASNPVEKLPVIFRVSKNDPTDVFAIFPTLPGTYDPSSATVYQHVGQHSSGDLRGMIKSSRLATRKEYADLYRELRSIYEKHAGAHLKGAVKLVIVQRVSAEMDTERRSLARTPA